MHIRNIKYYPDDTKTPDLVGTTQSVSLLESLAIVAVVYVPGIIVLAVIISILS